MTGNYEKGPGDLWIPPDSPEPAELSENESLVQSEPPVTDAEYFRALLREVRASILAQMNCGPSRYEYLSDGPADGACA